MAHLDHRSNAAPTRAIGQNNKVAVSHGRAVAAEQSAFDCGGFLIVSSVMCLIE
ncbi:MAG: hypothetical protein ACYSN7_04935 [Planctomycetota bacterium]